MYRPIWSAVILEELAYEEERKLIRRRAEPALAAHRACPLVAEMRRAFDDAEVIGWEVLEGRYGLPDPDDEHVVAAAVGGGASAIITHNTKDFPSALLPLGLQILSPRQFAAATVGLSPTRAMAAVQAIAIRSGRAGRRLTQLDILDILESRYGMRHAVELLRPFAGGGCDSPDITTDLSGAARHRRVRHAV